MVFPKFPILLNLPKFTPFTFALCSFIFALSSLLFHLCSFISLLTPLTTKRLTNIVSRLCGLSLFLLGGGGVFHKFGF